MPMTHPTACVWSLRCHIGVRDAMLPRDADDAAHIRTAGPCKFFGEAGEETLEARGRCDDPLMAGRRADVAITMHGPAGQVDHAPRPHLGPAPIHEIAVLAVNDEEHLILMRMDMGRRAITRRV